jgi:hypothetical protein
MLKEWGGDIDFDFDDYIEWRAVSIEYIST